MPPPTAEEVVEFRAYAEKARPLVGTSSIAKYHLEDVNRIVKFSMLEDYMNGLDEFGDVPNPPIDVREAYEKPIREAMVKNDPYTPRCNFPTAHMTEEFMVSGSFVRPMKKILERLNVAPKWRYPDFNDLVREAVISDKKRATYRPFLNTEQRERKMVTDATRKMRRALKGDRGPEPVPRRRILRRGAPVTIRRSKPLPQLITFDTTSLFYPAHDHGIHLRDFAQKYVPDMIVRADYFEKAYEEAYREVDALYPAFGIEIEMACVDWWEKVYYRAFEKVVGAENMRFIPTRRIAKTMYYDMYTTGQNEGGWWKIREGVREVLVRLRADLQTKNLQLAVVSNFDDRLNGILDSFGIIEAFDFVLSSRDLGVAKPNRAVFDIARNTAKMKGRIDSPLHCLHVGDDWERDVLASLDAGWQAAHFVQGSKLMEQSLYNPVDGLTPGADYQIMAELVPLVQRFGGETYDLKSGVEEAHFYEDDHGFHDQADDLASIRQWDA